MRLKLAVSSLSFVLLLGAAGALVASESGLTSGTPVLTSDELRAMAPEPLAAVADPATAVNVTPKGLAQAEELTSRDAAERQAKADAKKAKALADAKAKKDKSAKASKKDAKKSAKDSKKSEPSKDKLAAKTDAKKEGKKDAKKDSKTDPKKGAKDSKKSESSKDKLASKSKDKAKDKTNDKSKGKSKDKSKDKAVAKAKPVHHEDADADDATETVASAAKPSDDSSDDEAGDEPLIPAKPSKVKADAKSKADAKTKADDAKAKTNAKSDAKLADAKAKAAKSKAAKAKADAKLADAKGAVSSKSKATKPLTLAKNATKATGAAKLGRARALETDLAEKDSDTAADEATETETETAQAPKPVVDPTVVDSADQQRFTAAISKFLASIATVEAGGSVNVKLDGMKRRTVGGREAIVFACARVQAIESRFQTVHVKKGTIELRDLAFDAAQLKSGACALVGTPTVVPDLTLDHWQVRAQLGKNNIKDPSIVYENGQMVFTGKAPFMFFSIPFRMAGKLERNGNNIAFKIADLSIKGSAASADRLASTQAKLDGMIKLEQVLAPIGAPGAPVHGGRVNIEDGASVVYSTPIDAAVPAE